MSALQDYERLQAEFANSILPAEQAIRDILNLHQPDITWTVPDYRMVGVPDSQRMAPSCAECIDGQDPAPWPCDTAKLILARFP